MNISPTISAISETEYALYVLNGYNYAFESTPYWEAVDALAPGRELWGDTALKWEMNDFVAVFKLKKYRIKKLNFLWTRGAPTWNQQPSEEIEDLFATSLRNYVAAQDARIDFLRLGLFSDLGEPDCQQLSYDTTVVVNLQGEEADIKARMKKRGRRDVNKALRECTGICQEETFISEEDFRELAEIMVETGGRNKFTTKTKEFYFHFLAALRSLQSAAELPVRLFTYRDDGKVEAWALFTIFGDRATYYFAASSAEARKNLVADYLLWEAMKELAASGVTSLDLMGIGSDLAPGLRHLTTFKTKFSTKTVSVPPYREIVLHPLRYAFYNKLAAIKESLK